MNAEKVRADPIHLVDEGESWHMIFVRLAPDGFGLRLHTADCIVDHAGAIKHPHGALHFDGEINMPRRVDDVDAVFRIIPGHALPEAGRGGGGDGDATLLLLLHPVHGGGAGMHLAHFVAHATIEQDALGGGRFTCIDMRADADVAIAFNWRLSGHGDFLIGKIS